ncbi:MAG: MucR family transcriptional regulator [Rhodospirillales bacterium]
MATDIVSAYVSKNVLASEEISDLINAVYTALAGVQSDDVGRLANDQKPAVSVRRSITPEHIICLEDGKKLKMLKRYLRTNFNMTPEEYRAKWNLPHDYPMVAPNYAKQRSDFAKTIGLGKGSKSK